MSASIRSVAGDDRIRGTDAVAVPPAAGAASGRREGPVRASAALAGNWPALLACCFSVFMAQLDTTALNVAMPAIGRTFGGGVAGLQWVVDGYVLVLASCGMAGGALGDRYGRRRIYRLGLVLFSLSSLGCGLAPGLPALVAFRMLQAVGASMLMPVTLSIITVMFADPVVRARAIGVWVGAAGLAAGIGPLAGGLLVAGLGWRAVFWVNLPVGVLALVLTGRYLRESRAATPRAADIAGQVLLMVSLATLTYGLIEAPRRGWLSVATLAAFGAAALAATCFAVVESRVRQPLIDPDILRRPGFAGAGLTAVLVYLPVMGFLFVNAIYLQQVRGMSALAAGVAVLPTSLGQVVGGPLSGRLVTRYGARRVLMVAACCVAVAMTILVRLASTTPIPVLAVAYLLIGAGWGLANPPLTDAAIRALPRERAGVASATVGASRQLGAVLGVALLGSLVTTRMRALLPPAGASREVARLGSAGAAHPLDATARTAFTTATHLGYTVGLGAAVATMIVVALTVRGTARRHEVPRGPDGQEGPAT